MGADIHCYVIVKKPVYKRIEAPGTGFAKSGYKWKLVNFWEKNSMYYPESEDTWEKQEYVPSECFHDRNYQVFGVLAGVRSDEYPQMDEVRGLPSDCPQELVDYIDSWGPDAHDISWYSLAELNKAVKNKKKYPKHPLWYDDDGNPHKDKEDYGPHYGLKRLRDNVRCFAELDSWINDPEDVRVVFFFDS